MQRFLAIFAAVVAACSCAAGCAQQAPPPSVSTQRPTSLAQQRPMNMQDALHNAIEGIKTNPKLTAADKAMYIRQFERQMGGQGAVGPKPAAAKKAKGERG